MMAIIKGFPRQQYIIVTNLLGITFNNSANEITIFCV